jgi:hypothetical protein
LAGAEFDAARDLHRAVRQLGVRETVAGYLEDHAPAPLVAQVRRRVGEAWAVTRPVLKRRLIDLVRVQGDWWVELDALGTELTYGAQKVGADARVKGVAEGSIWLLQENLEIPFRIERRIGASVTLGDIRYDPQHRAVIGSLRDLEVFIGDHALAQLVARLAEALLEQQLPRANPVPILKRDQVQDMVGPMGGALKLQMGVEELELEVTEQDLTLKVRFGFTRGRIGAEGPQLETW